ncbi:5-formyltetrahydrofolate cyclo-ligase [Sporosarcina sp. 179-K 3D1 HS]|uniref:5-formyltetrahydrofolate cyclo-ligase n=1 Tax=Sporosarcina sp. 179-K 3D1 HS TaxID=3232169 RepID=UPI0039A3CF64
MSKNFQRNQMLELLNQMDDSIYRRFSGVILDRVLASEEFRNACTIGITISRFPEVDTIPLIKHAWEAGKKIATPKCIRSTRDMDFRIISSLDELETVYLNLREPIVEVTVPTGKEAIDLQIVPGVLFSPNGYRIGFGGGYYDRYLSDYRGKMISLAFSCQTGHDIPIEDHDIPVPKIFTEEGVLNCPKEMAR